MGNLNKPTTVENAQAGNVITVDVVKDRKSGESNGYALITMSTQNEVDKAFSMFNRYTLSEDVLKVSLAKPREQRSITDLIFD